MTERRLPTGSSSGPMAGPMARPMAGHEGDIDKAIESLEREGIAAKQKAQKLIELEHAKEIYKQQLVKGAAIVTGQVNTSGNGEIVTNSSTEQALVDPTTAQRNQAIAIGLELVISTGWTTLFHQDIDPLVLAGGVGLIIAAGQAITTKINNRKVK